jgi:DNA-binding MltR family transcriptional regulator
VEQDKELSKKSALKALSRAEPDSTYHADLQKELSATDNDRGYCLLVVSLLENQIDRVIEARISHFRSEDRNAFFDSHGPAGALSRKIALLNAFAVIGEVSRRNLDYIREIRNAFAHSKIPLTYATPEVKAMCDELRLIDPNNPMKAITDNHQGPSARDRFHDVLATTILLLSIYVGDPNRLSVIGLKSGQQLP